MVAEIKSFSEMYFEQGFEHPYGEDIKNEYLGKPVRVLYRAGNFLASTTILPLLGMGYHAYHAATDVNLREKHITALNCEFSAVLNTVSFIASALLLSKFAAPTLVLKALALSNFSWMVLSFLPDAVSVLRKMPTPILMIMTAQMTIAVGLTYYFGSFASLSKSVIGMNASFPAIGFAVYSLGVDKSGFSFMVELGIKMQTSLHPFIAKFIT